MGSTSIHLKVILHPNRIKVALKSYAADERKWIKFDVENETYTLEAIGATPPAGWTGYMPLNKK